MYERVGNVSMKIFLFIKIFCIFYLLSNCSPSIFDESNIDKELTNFDKILFPYLLSSYMCHSEFFNEYQETSTDQVYEKTFEWIRFRSAVGANIGEANDFCFGVKNAGNDLNLLFLHIKPGETCDSENNKVLFSLNKIKRAIWTWPKNESQKNFTLKISVEWIEKGQWKKNDLFFDLPHYPKNHTSIFWGKTWRNQKPFKELENMLPLHIFFIEDSISGDGVLRLPKGDGNGFASDEVLQVKRQVQRIDSFFVDGQAASQSLLTFFGITQGRISAESTVSFWRKNHKIPAARFFYNDATYYAISHAEFSARGEFPMGVKELEPGDKMEIFPNPSQGRININSKDALRADVYDLQGRMLSTIPISQGSMDCGLNSGIYMMKIYNQKGEVLSIQKIQIIP